MPSYRYCPDHPNANPNGMVTAGEAEEWKWRHAKVLNPAPFHYIADGMAPTRHMADGQFYTSKKQFREVTKAHGCIEVGNETAALTKPRKAVLPDRKKRRDSIKRTIWELNNGGSRYGPAK